MEDSIELKAGTKHTEMRAWTGVIVGESTILKVNRFVFLLLSRSLMVFLALLEVYYSLFYFSSSSPAITLPLHEALMNKRASSPQIQLCCICKRMLYPFSQTLAIANDTARTNTFCFFFRSDAHVPYR